MLDASDDQKRDNDVRCCLECNLGYYGRLECPNCQEPTGEPIPEEWLIAYSNQTNDDNN